MKVLIANVVFDPLRCMSRDEFIGVFDDDKLEKVKEIFEVSCEWPLTFYIYDVKVNQYKPEPIR